MTFNILIATIGRPTLQRMLNSLSPQLVESDCLTIVYDGHSTPPVFDLLDFKCKVVQHCEPVALGSWGHGIRNKYAPLLEKRDFVLHADDDDSYLPGAFAKLRIQCTNPETLYVAKMNNYGGIIPNGNVIKLNNIGTPCGIIPYDLNIKGTWRHQYGGDGLFYEEIAKSAKSIEHLQTVIYKVRG